MKRKVYIITPKEQLKSELVILYLHGGSYLAKMCLEHWNLLRDLCDNLKCTIIAPDYPLAPKSCYIDVFNMILPLYKKIIEKIETKNLILMGDSAGGGIALALEEKLGEENIALPIKLVLISPWLDVTMENVKIDEVQKNDKVLNKKVLKLAGEVYARREATKDYLVSPIYGPLDKLKNVTIFTGTHDILNPDIHLLTKKAREKKVNIQVEETEGAIHNWILERHNNVYMGNEGFRELLQVLSHGEEEIE